MEFPEPLGEGRLVGTETGQRGRKMVLEYRDSHPRGPTHSRERGEDTGASPASAPPITPGLPLAAHLRAAAGLGPRDTEQGEGRNDPRADRPSPPAPKHRALR